MEVTRPPRGALSRTLNSLTPAQERRVQDILDALAEDVRKRRVMTFPYFKDYDRVRLVISDLAVGGGDEIFPKK